MTPEALDQWRWEQAVNACVRGGYWKEISKEYSRLVREDVRPAEPCAVCGIENKSHFIHAAPFTEDYHEYVAPKPETAEPVAWIEHDGGPCPVDRSELVAVRTRGGSETIMNAGAVVWRYDSFIAEIHENMPSDCEVVQYRIIPTNPQPTVPVEVVEALEVLSSLSSYLGAGMGDDKTTARQFDERIRWGIDHIGSVYRNRAAQVVEECSKRPGTTWGEVRRAILDDTALPTAAIKGSRP